MPLILAVALIIILSLALYYGQVIVSKIRAGRMKKHALNLGLQYSAQEIPTDPGIPGDFLLFALGTPGDKKNVLQGRYNQLQIKIYEYDFTIHFNRMMETIPQTVLQAFLPDIDFPQFTLVPQRHLDAIYNNLVTQEGKDSLLGTAGIKLPNQPEFCEAYKLMGVNWQQLQIIFDHPAVIENLAILDSQSVKGRICVEGFGQHILIYPLYTLLNLKQLEQYIKNSTNLAKALAQKARHRNGQVNA
ncbi:MAG: hypothetical protein P1S60_07630 [Anaerolineae bacterium]|nr:hypothetical protein [Anaerolineae bacterium]